MDHAYLWSYFLYYSRCQYRVGSPLNNGLIYVKHRLMGLPGFPSSTGLVSAVSACSLKRMNCNDGRLVQG